MSAPRANALDVIGAGGGPLERSAGTRPIDGGAFPLIFELSRAGRRAWSLPEPATPAPVVETLVPQAHRRGRPPKLPEVSERDLVRHYTRLSQRNWAIDVGAYPLGSCSMKYNPKVAEDAAGMPGFATLHPAADDELMQGALELLGTLERALCEATAMSRLPFSPRPAPRARSPVCSSCARSMPLRGVSGEA